MCWWRCRGAGKGRRRPLHGFAFRFHIHIVYLSQFLHFKVFCVHAGSLCVGRWPVPDLGACVASCSRRTFGIERAHNSKSIIALPCSHAHPFTFSQPYTNTSMHIYSSNVISEMSNVESAVWLHTSAAHLAFTCLLASMRRAPKARWCAHKHHKKYLARGRCFWCACAHTQGNAAQRPTSPKGWRSSWLRAGVVSHSACIHFLSPIVTGIHSCIHSFPHPVFSMGRCLRRRHRHRRR
jgi:hypothetical protein